MEQAHVSTQHEVNKLWQQLLNILEQAHTQGQFHVLYANLKVAVALLQNTHFHNQLTLSAKDLDSIHHYVLTLGHAADEATFQRELHEKIANPLYEIITAINNKQGQSLQRVFREEIPWGGQTRFDFTPFHTALDKIDDDEKTHRIQILKKDFKRIQDFLETLDYKKVSTNLHEFFQQSLVNPFYEALKGLDSKLAQNFQATFKPETSLETFKQFDFAKFDKALNIINTDKYSFKLGHFKKTFKEQHKKRIEYLIEQLNIDPKKYNYHVFLELLVPYVKNLVAKYTSTLTAAYIKRILTVLESGWFVKQKQLPAYQLLWPALLALQNTFDTDCITQHFPVFAALKSNNTSEINTFTYGEIILAIHAIAQQISTVNKSAANNVEVLFNLIDIVFALNERLAQLSLTKIQCALLNDQEPRLRKMREVFETNNDSLAAQKEFSTNTLEFLKDLFKTCVDILGEPPIDMALCALGSSSRSDRRPYSDIELLLLYQQPEHKKLFKDNRQAHLETQRITLYLYHLLGLMELVIVSLGESHIDSVQTKEIKYGFHLDNTCHVLDKELFGTTHHIVTTHITDVIQARDTTTPMQNHPWYNGESFFALLQPKLINTDNLYGSNKIIKAYDIAVQSFLDAIPIANDEVAVLQTFLKLKVNINLFNLKRRELIALSALQHVLEKSAHYFNCKKDETVELKVAFYKPLTYLALSLKLFYNLTAEHPGDIFETVSQQLGWGQTAVLSLFNAALAFIAQIQNDLHQKAQQQEEHIIWLGREAVNIPPYQILAPIEYAILDLIQHSLIKPLANLLKSYYEKPASELKNILHLLLKSHLNYRNSDWVKKWTQHPTHAVTFDSLVAHPLINILADYPSPNGWSPTYACTMQRWRGQLQSITTDHKTLCLIEGISTLNKATSYLPQGIVAQLFDAQGEFKGNVLNSAQSKVSQVSWPASDPANAKVFYFKVKPDNDKGLMGREFAVINLHQLLGGQSHIALGWPLKLTYLTAKGSKVYYCWVSEGIPGKSLSEVMQAESDFANFQAHVDMQSYSHLFITHYLTSPEDGQPSNFKIKQIYDEPFKLYEFDVGQSFVGTIYEKRKVLAVKTMLYLLEPAIHQALDKQVLTRLMLLEPQALIKNWQSNIDEVKKIFEPFLVANMSGRRFIDLNEYIYCCVQTRFTLLHSWLYIYHQQVPSGFKLLKALDPAVAYRYLPLQGKIKNSKDFKDKLDRDAYRVNSNTGNMYSSTTYLQIQQQTLTPERLQATLDLGEEYFARIDFRKIEDKDEQVFFLKMLHAAVDCQKPFTYLSLSGCKVISESELLVLLQKLPNLTELKLEDCPQFNLSTLYSLLSKQITGFFRLEYEILCPTLKRIHLTIEDTVKIFQLPNNLANRKQILMVTAQSQKQFNHYWKKLLIWLDNNESILSATFFKSLGALTSRLSDAAVSVLCNKLLLLSDKTTSSTQANICQCLVKLTPRLSSEQITAVMKKLRTLRQSGDLEEKYEENYIAYTSLVMLVSKLSEVQVDMLCEKRLLLLNGKNYWHKDDFTTSIFNELKTKLSKAHINQLLERLQVGLINEDLSTQIALIQKLGELMPRLLEDSIFNQFKPKILEAQIDQLFKNLLTKLEDNNSSIQKAAIYSLCELMLRFSAEQVQQLFQKLLLLLQKTKDWNLRETVIEIFVKLMPRLSIEQMHQVFQKLLLIVENQDWKLQKAACLSFGKFAPLSLSEARAIFNCLGMLRLLKLSETQAFILFEKLLPWLEDSLLRDIVSQSLCELTPNLSVQQVHTFIKKVLQIKNKGLCSEDWIEQQCLVRLVPQLSTQQTYALVERMLLGLEEQYDLNQSIILRILYELVARVEDQSMLVEKLLLPQLENQHCHTKNMVIEILCHLSSRLSPVQVDEIFKRLLPSSSGKKTKQNFDLKKLAQLIANFVDATSCKLFILLIPILFELESKLSPGVFERITSFFSIVVEFLSKLSKASEKLQPALEKTTEQNFDLERLAELMPRLTEKHLQVVLDKQLILFEEQAENIQPSIIKILRLLSSKFSDKQIHLLIDKLLSPPLRSLDWHMQNDVIEILCQFSPKLSHEQVDEVFKRLLPFLGQRTDLKILEQLVPKLSDKYAQVAFEKLQILLDDQYTKSDQKSAIEILCQSSSKLSNEQIQIKFKKLLLLLKSKTWFGFVQDISTIQYAIQKLGNLLPLFSAEQVQIIFKEMMLFLKQQDLSLINMAVEMLCQLTPKLSDEEIHIFFEKMLLLEDINWKIIPIQKITVEQIFILFTKLLPWLKTKGNGYPRKFCTQLISKLSAEQVLTVQINTLFEQILTCLKEKNSNIQDAINSLLDWLIPKLSSQQINVLFKELFFLLANSDTHIREKTIARFSHLAPRLSLEQVEKVIEKLLPRLDDKNSDVRDKVIVTLAFFYSTQVQLSLLRRSILNSYRVTSAQWVEITHSINQFTIQKVFSFLDQDILMKVVPCINKEWRRWQKVYLQQQVELFHEQNNLMLEPMQTQNKEDFQMEFQHFLQPDKASVAIEPVSVKPNDNHKIQGNLISSVVVAQKKMNLAQTLFYSKTTPTALSKRYTVQIDQLLRTFEVQAVAGDGDCGYTAFGITRTQAYQLLLANLDKIRLLIKPALQEALRTQVFINALKSKGQLIQALSMAYANYQQASKGGEMPQSVLDALDSTGEDLTILRAYIEYDVNEKQIDAGWSHPSILFALAEIQGIELHIWQENAQGQLIPHPYYAQHIPVHATQRNDLLFVNGNHFERLEPVTNLDPIYEVSNTNVSKPF